MKPIQKVKSLSLSVRLLLGLLFAFGLAIPTALASSSGPADNNYIIYPPTDAGSSDQDGPRIQFGIDNKLSRNAADAGTTVGYIPYQFLVASSQPQARFQMRGGRWDDSGGSADWYDFAGGNPGWVINDFIKKRGLLSPIYYEVYQLWGDNAQAGGGGGNGKLLGVINPRDGNIFPSTDQNPSNDNCGTWGCWRQFDAGTGGGLITLDGSQQDSCSKRIATHNNQCYAGSPIARAESLPNSRTVATAPEDLWTHNNFSITAAEDIQFGLAAQKQLAKQEGIDLAKKQPPGMLASVFDKYGKGLKEFFLGSRAFALESLTVQVNPGGTVAGAAQEVGVKIDPANCQGGSYKPVPSDGNMSFGQCGETDHTASFAGASYGEAAPTTITNGNQTCGIENGSSPANNTATPDLSYRCTHPIKVTVSPTRDNGGHAITGGPTGAASHVHVEVHNKTHPSDECNDTYQPVGDDGSVTFYGCRTNDTFGVSIKEDQFDDTGTNDYHCEIGSNVKTRDVTDADANFKYDCYQALASDGGFMSSGSFAGVDDHRFGSSDGNVDHQRNLNGNYVFLIKVVNYADINHGYVTTYDRLTGGNGDNANCLYLNGHNEGNEVTCPTDLFQRAQSENTEQVVRNGFYLRAPKYLNSFSDRQYLAAAPSKVSFGINHGAGPGGQSSYGGVNFAGGGTACRTPYPGDYIDASSNQNPPNIITTADWDRSSQWWQLGSDNDIWANINRIGWRDDRGNLHTENPAISQPGYPNMQLGVPPPSADWMPANDVNAAGGWVNTAMINKGVGNSAISGSWQSSTTNRINDINSQWAFQINNPGLPNQINPFLNNGTEGGPWGMNDSYAGQMPIFQWDKGNLLLMGGQAFTTGFWPTCRPANPTPLTPKSVDSGYKYDGQDSITSNPFGSDPNAVLNFNFQYNLPEFRPKVDWRVDISPNSSFSGLALQSAGTDLNVEAPGAKSAPINTNGLQANTDYYWRGCINDQVNGDRCTTPTIKFRINKGPTSQVVSADPANPTNSGNVNYNCSKLAMILTDPEGNQVRPYFTATWTDSSDQINTVSSYDRTGISDNWSSWVSGNGYRASGLTFTSDEVKPKVWTVNGVRRSVPNKTFTQFLQQDVPESANVTWVGRGEDRYGASDLDSFLWLAPPVGNSTPQATLNSGYSTDQQSPLNNRRFGAPVATNYHKNTRPNLNTASTKKFKDFSGTPVTSVTDGQTVQVETKLVNGGETPTKSYRIADYLGSVRDFEPPITNDPSRPITVQYNNGPQTTVSPAISAVIPNHQNGNLDQPENAGSTNDDRQASYKLNFGANPIQGGSSSIINGKDYSSCQYAGGGAYCLTNYATYPNSVYFYCGGTSNLPGSCGGTNNAAAVWSYKFNNTSASTYDLTLSYYNRPNPDPGGTPPAGYGSYHVKLDYPGGSQTVNLPIESDSRAQSLHSYTLSGLNITGVNPTVTLTWDNDAWTGGDANFGLNSLQLNPVIPSGSILRPGQLNPGESVTLSYYIRADRNRTADPKTDQNGNFQRRLGVGSTASPQPAPSADPKGGTIDIGDAHTFVPFSEDYCNTANPLINHTCEFKPGDVLAPFLRTQRGSVASNGGVFGYDALAGTSNATFLVQANGVLSHFTSQTGTLPNYTSQQAVCTAPGQGERPGGVDWRRTMIANIIKLNSGTKNTTHTNTGPLLNPGGGNPRGKLDGSGAGRNGNVWVVGSPTVPEDLTISNPIAFKGVGTILVFGDLTIGPGADLTYQPDTGGVNSLGVIVVGNLNIDPTVSNLVGSYYVLDSQPSVDANGCPQNIDIAKNSRGTVSTGASSNRLNVQGLMVAGKFDFLRYFTNPSDSEADPAENVYYDGRVLANTPPGFGTFRNTAAWYEIAPN